jgi:hypothetical protein
VGTQAHVCGMGDAGQAFWEWVVLSLGGPERWRNVRFARWDGWLGHCGQAGVIGIGA